MARSLHRPAEADPGSSVAGMEPDFVSDVGELVPCGDCFAVVQRGDLKKHAEWHGRASRDAVAAALMVSNGPPTDVAPAAPASPPAEAEQWPTHCPTCGTRLTSAVIDFDKSNDDRAELQPGEMVAVDYCPNPDCPSNQGDTTPTG
jgi:hypothetical protein